MFDCHLHVETGLDKYDADITSGNIIFNSIESYEKHGPLHPNYFHSLIFDFNKEITYFKKLIQSKKIVCLKIHSRIQKISVKDYSYLIQRLKDLDENIPIIYDAFYYGEDILFQPNLIELINLVKTFPERKFIIAHAGGYEILKYYFHLRTFSNVGYDLSLSLQYLEDSSCKQDLLKLIKYTSHEKLFFGSDYPFASPKNQYNILKQILADLNFDSEQTSLIFENSWLNFINNK
ncbi:MAG: amidohydrolase family protein [Bacteroidota bacterium]|nr:amidohydrolase family protein [Bacteroidota bacterium]